MVPAARSSPPSLLWPLRKAGRVSASLFQVRLGARLDSGHRRDETATDVRPLTREERSIAAFALDLDRRATASLHADHTDQVSELLTAFQITHIYADIERLVAPP